jgi:hypothetical protein
MEEYFELVGQYVETAESKVRKIMQEFAKIGINRETARKLFKNFFESLKQPPKATGPPLDEYFDLVNYYVATAVKVIDFLKQKLESVTTHLVEEKRTLVPILNQISEIEILRTSAEPDVDTPELINTLIKIGCTNSGYSFVHTLDDFKKYLNGSTVDYYLNVTISSFWKYSYERVKIYVENKRIMHLYGLMRPKFDDLRKVTVVDKLPEGKIDEFKLAERLFNEYDEKKQIVDQITITSKFNDLYQTTGADYRNALKTVTRIIKFMQGGVSQAFLILRNTNDVKPRPLPGSKDANRNKLLIREKNDKEKTDKLMFVDNDGKLITDKNNNFEDVFDHNTPREIINTAILSRKNYFVLEAGGTVIIIAYGQSGSGKTYTLTGLIEYFSSNPDKFELMGISSVQFYNDVKLDNSGKYRFTATPKSSWPADAAKRATYRMNELTQADLIQDPRYEMTKMYDVCKLLDPPLILKIKPVVTPMPPLTNPTAYMKEIELYSNEAFRALTEMNDLATSEPKLNRLFETYKQMVLEFREKAVQEVLNKAYRLFCDNEFYLPLYTFQHRKLSVRTMQEAVKQKVKELICSQYAIMTDKFEFRMTQTDLETLLDQSFIETDLFLRKEAEAIKICLDGENSLLQNAKSLVSYFKSFLKLRRCVHVLCDARQIRNLEDAVYEVGNMFFNHGKLCTKHVESAKYQLKLSLNELFQSYYLADLFASKENDKYDLRTVPNESPFMINFQREIIMESHTMMEYVILTCDSQTDLFVIRAGDRMAQHVAPYTRLSYINLVEAEKREREHAETESAKKYMIQKLVEKLTKKESSTRIWALTPFFNEVPNPNKHGSMMRQIMLMNKHGKTNLNEEFIREYTNDQGRMIEKIKFQGTDFLSKIGPYVAKVAFLNLVNTYPIATFEIIETQGKGEATWKVVTPTHTYNAYSIKTWQDRNGDEMYASYAKQVQETWDNPRTFQSKFEHCIDISKTGPDNASNYALFDHEELRYKNYFPKEQERIQAAFTRTFNIPPMPFKPPLNPKTQQPKTLKDVYDDINAARFTRAMPQNPESSRSQLVTTLHLRHATSKNESKLIFIDLAGNEKVDTSKRHIVTCESVYINSTLQFVTEMFLSLKETRQQQPPHDDADPFQRFLFEISTTPASGLKPAIVMVVCAYEYYSSWIPPNPLYEVSKESLKKTFQFIEALFSFGAQVATREDGIEDTHTKQEKLLIKGGRTRRFRNTRRKRKRGRASRRGKRSRK